MTDDKDRAAFVARPGAVATTTGTYVCAWALPLNRTHVMVRSGPAGPPRSMRRFVTGYAFAHTRRHRRIATLRADLAAHFVTELELSLAETRGSSGSPRSRWAKHVYLSAAAGRR